jgi:hypothetical protein
MEQIIYCKPKKVESKEGFGKDGRSCEVGTGFITCVR